MRSYYLHELTRLDVETLLMNDPNTVVIFCLGSIEQHGDHLPLGTDIISVQSRALAIAKKTNSIICVTTLAGYSPQHMSFKGTISLRQETLSNIIIDTITSLSFHTFKRILILNTHASNEAIIESTIMKIRETHQISIAFTRKYPEAFIKIIQNRKYATLDIHAGLSETSIMKAIRPELVDEKAMENYSIQNEFNYFDKISAKDNIDDVDKFLFDTLLPSKTECVSKNGVYGISDIMNADASTYNNNIDKSIQFYVEFIKRWKETDV